MSGVREFVIVVRCLSRVAGTSVASGPLAAVAFVREARCSRSSFARGFRSRSRRTRTPATRPDPPRTPSGRGGRSSAHRLLSPSKKVVGKAKRLLGDALGGVAVLTDVLAADDALAVRDTETAVVLLFDARGEAVMRPVRMATFLGK